jgi:hypothetical protein
MKIKPFKSLYDSLPGEIFCLCLSCNVKVTRSGYKHVFENKARKIIDIKFRAKAIEHIPRLIETINVYQFHSKQLRRNGDIEFWNLQGVINNVCIHITLRKIGNQDLHLYSWHYKGASPKILDSV